MRDLGWFLGGLGVLLYALVQSAVLVLGWLDARAKRAVHDKMMAGLHEGLNEAWKSLASIQDPPKEPWQ